MKKFLKVAVSALVCITMLSSLVGCGDKKESAEGKKLRIYFADAVKPDLALVAEEVSKITMEEIGVGVEFVQFGSGEYDQKMQLLMASNEEMDIVYDAQDSYVSHARSGNYLDITELLETKAPKLKEEIYDELWQGVTVDGKIYGVPTKKEMAAQPALFVQDTFLEKNNINTDDIKTLADMEDILKLLKEDSQRAGFMIAANQQHEPIDYYEKYEKITEAFMITKGDKEEIVNYYMTDDYADFAGLMRDWYNKGYIAADVAVNNDYTMYLNEKDRSGVRYTSYSPYAEYSEQDETQRMRPITFIRPIIANNSTRGSIFCICQKSKMPEKAIEFLQLWNTDSRIKNLIAFGIEGKHYTLEDGKVKVMPNKNNLYTNQNWRTGNMLIGYLTVTEPDDKWEKFDEFNNSAEISKVLGFSPDLDSVKDKIAACKNVASEYCSLLSCGAVDPKTELPKMKKAFKEAGSDDVIKEIQKQYDEWKSSKK